MPQRTFPDHERRVEYRVVGRGYWTQTTTKEEYDFQWPGDQQAEYDREAALSVLESWRHMDSLTWVDGPYLEQHAVIVTAWVREDQLPVSGPQNGTGGPQSGT